MSKVRWIVRLKKDKEYLGTLKYSEHTGTGFLFSDIDEVCDPFAVEFAKELPYKVDKMPVWFMFDPDAPYTGVSGVIIKCS